MAPVSKRTSSNCKAAGCPSRMLQSAQSPPKRLGRILEVEMDRRMLRMATVHFLLGRLRL